MRVSFCYWTQTKKLPPSASCDLKGREQHTNMGGSCTPDGLWGHWPHSTQSLAASGLMNTHLWFSRQLESGFCSLWPNHFKYTKGLIYLFSQEWSFSKLYQGFPDSSANKESTYNAGDPSLIPELGRSSGEGIGYPPQYSWASLVAQLVKNPPAMRETCVRSLGWEDLLEKGKATHSSILAWRILWTL